MKEKELRQLVEELCEFNSQREEEFRKREQRKMKLLFPKKQQKSQKKA